jgi:tetratricopeptide (TPR) repeat protein
MDATDPENFHQRGIANWQNGRPLVAMADFDAALKLKPDHVPALLSRGALRVALKNKEGAIADLDAAEKLSPSDFEIPLRTAGAFQSFGDFEEAIARYNAWEKAHPKDDRLRDMLASRCRARSMAQRELDLALADCDLALKKGLRNSNVYDARGFVHLLRDDFDKAFQDYDTALELQPKKAPSLYGRGIAQIKRGARAEGEADMKAALELEPMVRQMFTRVGITPL